MSQEARTPVALPRLFQQYFSRWVLYGNSFIKIVCACRVLLLYTRWFHRFGAQKCKNRLAQAATGGSFSIDVLMNKLKRMRLAIFIRERKGIHVA